MSSTGHLLLIERFFGFGDASFGKTFVVLIQLGAILAILSGLFRKIVANCARHVLRSDARRFVIGVLIAFLPAAIIGALAHGFIKDVLFNPWIVCFTLILGGAVLLWVDQLELKPRFFDATAFPLPMYLSIGFAQVPGDDSRRVALGRHHRLGDAARGRTSARRPSSRFSSPSRPWRAPSPTTSTRIAAS